MSDGTRRKHHYKREESSSSDSEVEYGERNDYCKGDEIPPPDFYCRICKSSMNSNLTWKMHISGKKHIKNMTAASYSLRKQVKIPPGTITQTVKVKDSASADISTRPGTEQAYIQEKFERINDQAVLGLDFVNEIWRMDSSLGPAYLCTLCQSECQSVTITNHVIGFRHRLRYLKHVDKATHERFASSSERKSIVSENLARFAKKLEKQYGKGTVQVLHEVSSVKSEESSEESEDEYRVRSPVVENPPSMESSKTLRSKISEQRNLGLAAMAPPERPPKVIQISQALRNVLAKRFETIEDPNRHAAILKTFGCTDEGAMPSENAAAQKLRESSLDTYIKSKIEALPEDRRRSMVEECKWRNWGPLREYLEIEKIAAAQEDLESVLEAQLRNGNERETD